jgi:uncharacterized membrane protein YdjX (TVP38/TMEM64 family)
VHALVRRRRGDPLEQRFVAWRWIAIASAVAGLAVLAMYLPLGEWSGLLEAKLDAMDLLIALVVFVAVSIVGTLLLVPLSIFQLVAGAVFGFLWGTAAAIASSMGAALVAFLLSRHFFRGRVRKRMHGTKTFKALDEAVAKDGWKIVALLRLSPITSSAVKSYLLGLTRVDLRTYASASFTGFLPGLVLDVYVGDAGRHALSGGLLEWSLLAAGIAAMIALSTILRRLTRRRLAFAS